MKFPLKRVFPTAAVCVAAHHFVGLRKHNYHAGSLFGMLHARKPVAPLFPSYPCQMIATDCYSLNGGNYLVIKVLRDYFVFEDMSRKQ